MNSSIEQLQQAFNTLTREMEKDGRDLHDKEREHERQEGKVKKIEIELSHEKPIAEKLKVEVDHLRIKVTSHEAELARIHSEIETIVRIGKK